MTSRRRSATRTPTRRWRQTSISSSAGIRRAGTPRVRANSHYDAEARTVTLDFAQSCAPTLEQPVKAPFVIPIAIGLIAGDGRSSPIEVGRGKTPTVRTSHAVVLTEERTSVTFHDVAAEPVPSILRAFSAPVVLEFDYNGMRSC